MEKEYLSRKELENKTENLVKEFNKLTKTKNNVETGFAIAMLCTTISGLLMGNLPLIIITLILAITTFVYSTHMLGTIRSVKDEYKNVQHQLDDIISIDFEKKRYALEKKYNNTNTNNDLIKSIQEEKELLEKYKQDLNQYEIHRIDDELIGEINSRNYTLQKLNK